MERVEVIVIGLGAAGAAVTYQLAKQGTRVLGIDRFSPPHDMGATSGDTRITRQAIGESGPYVPLVLRSHEIWREIEAETGADLLTITGGLIMQPAASRAGQHGVQDFVSRTIAAARTYGIRHETPDTDEIRRRFPQFDLTEDHRAYYEPGAGFVRPEAAVRSQVELAGRLGAVIRRDELVVQVRDDGSGVEVRTGRSTYNADHAVLATGPWLPELIEDPEVSTLLRLYRQVLYWFDIEEGFAGFTSNRFPVFIWIFGTQGEQIYGFPAVDGPDGGLKVATEQYLATTTAVLMEREVRPDETSRMFERCVRGRMAGLSARCVRAKACAYTVTPDFNFIIDRLPGARNVTLVSSCSGHGFKHSAAIGEAVSQQLTTGSSTNDLSPFGLGRFRRPARTLASPPE